MTPALSFTITGVPVGKARPRVTRAGGTYTPQATKRHEAYVAHCGRLAMAGRPPLEGPVGAHFRFVYRAPRSWSGKKREAARWAIGRNDLDNLCKAVADGLNGICYGDDRQIVSLTAAKQYGAEDHTFVQLWSIRE